MDNKNITRTGTTCVGIIYKDGVVLAADRRTSAGYIVSDKSVKLHKLADNVAATHSGTVSDAQLHGRVIVAEIKLKEYNAERRIFVKEAASIANNIQYRNVRSPTTIEPIVGYLIGGVDHLGPQLFEVGPDGTLLEFTSFAADGSGSIFIKSLLETEYKKDMSEEEAVALAEKALSSAMKIDSHSGGGIVMAVVTEDNVREFEKKILRSELIKE